MGWRLMMGGGVREKGLNLKGWKTFISILMKNVLMHRLLENLNGEMMGCQCAKRRMVTTRGWGWGVGIA